MIIGHSFENLIDKNAFERIKNCNNGLKLIKSSTAKKIAYVQITLEIKEGVIK